MSSRSSKKTKMDNKDYWENYYKEHKQAPPSSFAEYCKPLILEGQKVIDLGCGNKRDTLYFRLFGISVAPVDLYAPNAINMSADEVKIQDGSVVYARFFFHAIDEETEDILLKNIADAKATLMAEFRLAYSYHQDITKCEVPDTTHGRRLIDPAEFLGKLEQLGMDVVVYNEGFFSPHGEDNPLLARVIARADS